MTMSWVRVILKIAGDYDGPGQLGRDVHQALDVLCFVPETTRGQDELSFGSRGEVFGIAAVRNDARFVQWSIMGVQRLHHRRARCYHEISGAETIHHFGFVMPPLARRCVAFDGLPPGINT